MRLTRQAAACLLGWPPLMIFRRDCMLFDIPWAIVDLETTGGHIGRDRITEIGLILLDGEQQQRYQTLVNPLQPIPPFIENMTGISNAMVQDAAPFSAIAADLLPMLQGRLLLAHNVRFDYGFLRNEFRRVGLRLQSATLCTVKLSRRLYPSISSTIWTASSSAMVCS
jgi:DNA polymerase-3 subunit epsilon